MAETAMQYDIIIIGAGPAGATLARLLDKCYKVAVVDKKSETGGFHKPCGGLLAPDAQKALAVHNLALPASILVDPQIFAVKTLDLNSGLIRYYQRFYLNLDRQRFDLWLISLIPEERDRYIDKCVKIEKTDKGFLVTLASGTVLAGRVLVGADGAESIVRRSFFKHKPESYITIQQWFKHDKVEPLYSAIFDSTLTPSYAWTVAKDGWFIFGAALKRRGCREKFSQLKKKLEGYGYSFDGLERTEACKVDCPLSQKDIIAGTTDLYFVGEAGGLISPSSLEGISYAIDSATMLAGALNKGLDGAFKRYRRCYFFLRIKLFIKKLKMPFMYNRFLRWLVMKTGISSIKPVK